MDVWLQPGFVRDGRNELVTPAGHGRNIAVVPERLAERLAESRNVLIEIVLLDDSVRPQCGHKFVLGDNPAAVRQKVKKRVVNLRLERYVTAIRCEKQSASSVENEIAEPISP